VSKTRNWQIRRTSIRVIRALAYLSRIDDLRKVNASIRFVSFEPLLGSVGEPDLRKIDWVIVGGESGPRSPPMLEEWVCRRSGTAFFFKQCGGVRKHETGRTYRGQTFDEMSSVLATL
jgi:protein gp37